MKKSIMCFLREQKRKRIRTKVIENYIINKFDTKKYWNMGGYPQFARSINNLVGEGKIRPIKAWKKNGMSPTLYNGYQIISTVKDFSPEVKQKLLTFYHPVLNMSYFLTHPDKYRKYEEYLDKIDRFFKKKSTITNMPALTINERSFQIFNNEKWLSKSGQNFLKYVGLTYDQLNCYQTFEPFFYYTGKITDKINALIIENKDTFYSLKMLFQNNVYTWNGIRFNFLIYGEGKKIIKSFSFFNELEEYKNYKTTFYYFGDIDPEGIKIWNSLNEVAEYKINPFTYFYSFLVENFKDQAPELEKDQNMPDKNILNLFLSFFNNNMKNNIKDIFERGCYLPQEAINYSILEELADVDR
ncbi:Wadjet anti-phage system protein JetD domain-containing protein [Natronospora cellulosivora (SeqCode)]